MGQILKRLKNPLPSKWLWVVLAVLLATILLFILFDLSLREISQPPYQLPDSSSINVKEFFDELESDMFSNSEYPIVVGNTVFTWQELSEVFDFERKIWEQRSHSWQEKGLIYDSIRKEIVERVVERMIIQKIAQGKGLTVTSAEIEKSKKDLFNFDTEPTGLVGLPDLEKRIYTRALKDKINQEVVRRYSGVLFYVKFKSFDARILGSQGVDVKSLADDKIREYHSLASKRVGKDILLERFGEDEEIASLNGVAGPEVFVATSIHDLALPSPEFRNMVRQTGVERISQITEMTTVLDPQSNKLEPFAFGFVQIEEKSGRNDTHSISNLIKREKEETHIEVLVKGWPGENY